MIRKIFKTGHSYAVTLSKKILEQAGLKLGDAIDVKAEDDGQTITIKKSKKNTQLTMPLNSRPRLGGVRKTIND